MLHFPIIIATQIPDVLFTGTMHEINFQCEVGLCSVTFLHFAETHEHIFIVMYVFIMDIYILKAFTGFFSLQSLFM